MNKRKSYFKFPLLNNKQWLEEKYIKERLSCGEMAQLIGCTKDGARVALIRNNIFLRLAKETNKIIFEKGGSKSRLYPHLNDGDWLEQKYLIEKMSVPEISKLIGTKSERSVSQALYKFNIPLRDSKTAAKLSFYKNKNKNFDDNFKIIENVLNGCLLGDASYDAYNRRSDFSYPHFSKKNKFLDHIGYVGEILFGENWTNRVFDDYSYLNNKCYKYYKITSLSHEKLLPNYRKWYPEWNNYIKVIPDDLEVDEILLLHWFLDDGSSTFRKRKYPNGWTQRKKQIVIYLSSQCFMKNQQEFLCEKVNSKFNLGFRVSKCNDGTGWRIKVPQSKAQDFFNVIGPPPVKSLAYKWK